MEDKRFAIAGGGIAGLTAAIALQRKGIYANVFEAAPALKQLGAGLALAANAIKAFQKIDIADDIIAKGNFLSALSIYDEKGKLIIRTDTKEVSKKYGLDNFTIHRAALHEALLSKIHPGRLHLNKRIIDIYKDKALLTLKFDDGSCEVCDYLVAADGIHSFARQKFVPSMAPRYSDYTCWRATVKNNFGTLEEASEFWGIKGRVGLVPLAENKIYWFACVNAARNDPAMKAMTINGLLTIFKHFPEPIPAIIERTTQESLIWNDIYDLPPLKEYALGNILLIGDAAHATTPNMGQGACQAIEDAVILAEELGQHNDAVIAFKSFEKRRMKRTQEIVRNSRLLGRVAQCENRMLAEIRNSLFRLLPASINEKQLDKLYNVDL